MDLGILGTILTLALGAAGSAVGCGLAGMTSHGVMARTDEGHGSFILLSAMPSSQTIYGFVLMFLLKGAEIDHVAKLSIGATTGTAFMMSAIYQGKACSSAILGVAKSPGIFGKSIIAPAIVESFAIFALVGGILLLT